MALEETFLQNWIMAKFVLPFFLVWFIVFAILEKAKPLGEKHQLNALVSTVIGLIFVSAVFPKEVVGNLILFLSVAIVVVFVALLIWGLIFGKEVQLEGSVKKLAGIGVVVAVIIAVFWAMGLRIEFLNELINFLFYSGWSETFWTNGIFIVLIAVAMALMWKGSK